MGPSPALRARRTASDSSVFHESAEALRALSFASADERAWSRSLASATAQLLDALGRDAEATEPTRAAGERLARRVLHELEAVDSAPAADGARR